MKVETLSLPHLVRYGLTGLLAIALFGFIPAALSKPELLKELESVGSMAGVWAAGVVAGFLLDALKLYQFSPGYKSGRKALQAKVAQALGVEPADAMAYFAKALQLERDNAGGVIFFAHSRWVLMNVSATLFALAALLWSGVAVCLCIIGCSSQALNYGCVGLVLGALAGRLHVTSKEEEKNTDEAYVVFCRDNKATLLAPVMPKSACVGVGGQI